MNRLALIGLLLAIAQVLWGQGAATQSDPGVKLETLKKKEDSAKVWRDGEVVKVQITSVSGIGQAELRRTGDRWPAQLELIFRYGDERPFQTLEGFGVTIRGDKGEDMWRHPAEKADPRKPIVIKIPADAGGMRLIVKWIDAYR